MLLDAAKQYVAPWRQSKTPLVMKASSELELLLPAKKLDDILNEVF